MKDQLRSLIDFRSGLKSATSALSGATLVPLKRSSPNITRLAVGELRMAKTTSSSCKAKIAEGATVSRMSW
ncbi:hypothetical protein HYQ46_013003 [Verticillium longisporum]|nr:hypothetical protein HYQ46_013003 [Verticillium longisporum]